MMQDTDNKPRLVADERQTVLEIIIQEKMKHYEMMYQKHGSIEYAMGTVYFELWLWKTIEYCDMKTHCLIED